MIKTTILTTIILFSATMMLQEVSSETPPLSIEKGGTGHEIPGWVKTTSAFWANGDISDTEYVNAIEYLLKERIMTVPSTVQTAEGQEITQSIEVLEKRVAQIESSDDEKTQATVATLDRQIEIFDGGPQALKTLDPEKLSSLNCGEAKDDANINIKAAVAICKVGSWLLDKAKESLDEEEQQQIEFETLGQQIQKAEVQDLDDTAEIPAGATGTYVKYKKGVADNSLTVMCDPGDVATGGGFMPVIELEMSYHASMPHPTNYANNPRMNNPTGWTFYSMESGEARVWVVCLDLTPSALSANTIP